MNIQAVINNNTINYPIETNLEKRSVETSRVY